MPDVWKCRVDEMSRKTTVTETAERRILQLSESDGERTAPKQTLLVYGMEVDEIGGTILSPDEAYVTLPDERFDELARILEDARKHERIVELDLRTTKDGRVVELSYRFGSGTDINQLRKTDLGPTGTT